jgi:hypothetical protein
VDERGRGVEVSGVESENDDAGEEDQRGVAKSEGKGERHGRDGRGLVERSLPGRGHAKGLLSDRTQGLQVICREHHSSTLIYDRSKYTK